MSILVEDVRAIYGNAAALSNAQIEDVIEFVQELTDEILAESGYSNTMLYAIQRYLTAHYLVIGFEQGGIVRKRTGDSEERYREMSLETSGLALTNFGQQALSLDTGGYLSKLATKSVKAQFRVV